VFWKIFATKEGVTEIGVGSVDAGFSSDATGDADISDVKMKNAKNRPFRNERDTGHILYCEKNQDSLINWKDRSNV
jgi:hypothetical protein